MAASEGEQAQLLRVVRRALFPQAARRDGVREPRSQKLVKRPLAALGSIGLAAVAWGQFEAGWVRLRTLNVALPGLPAELDGLRIVHLSDFHLGFPSRGEHAVHRAVHWAAEREPDLTVITGDLLSLPERPRRLRMLLDLLPGSFAVLGNHDYASSRDPFSKPSAVTELRLDHRPGRRGANPSSSVVARCKSSASILGRIEGTAHPERLADPDADLRILLCHFPM